MEDAAREQSYLRMLVNMSQYQLICNLHLIIQLESSVFVFIMGCHQLKALRSRKYSGSQLCDLPQLAHAAYLHPFDNKNIASMIETGTVGTDELTRGEVIARELASRHVIARRIVAEVRDDVIVPVHECDTREQVRNYHIAVLVDIEMARRVGAVEEVDVFTFEREALDALIGAVGDIQYWLRTTCIEEDAVRAEKLASILAGAAEGADIFSLAVVLNDVTRTISIANIDIAVGRDGQVCRTELQWFTVWAWLRIRLGFFGITQREYLFTIQRGLYYQATLNVAEVQKLGAAFLPDVEAVSASAELLAPALDELSLVIEDHHAVRLLACGVDSVVNVDVSLRVFADAMRVAILDVSGKFSPIVRDLVSMFSGTENGLFAAGFIRSSKNQRRNETRSNLSKKSAARYRHVWHSLAVWRSGLTLTHARRLLVD